MTRVMRTALVLVVVVLVGPGPGRPEPGPEPGPEAEGSSAVVNATRGLDSGNPFWDRLYVDCGKRTSLRCVQKSVFRFLKKSLGEKDVFVTDSLVFRRNHNAALSAHPLADVHNLLLPAQQKDQDDDNDVADEDSFSAAPLPTVEDLTDDLYDQGMSFIKSHDVHLRLPSLLGGAEVRLSPRAFEEDGATFKISFSRPHVDPADDAAPSARMFFKGGGGIIKKVTQKLFKKKLMTSFFALLLIVKMIKVKIMFLLPLILGVGTAKKLLLKVLLFLFPALSHLFKLCSYYHANYAKYHHHHHKVAHHHHVIPVPVPQPVPVAAPSPPYSGHSSYVPDPSGPVYGAPPSGPGGPLGGPPGGPQGHPGAGNPFDSWGGGTPSGPGGGLGGGPGGGYEYGVNRNENLGVLPAHQQNNNEVMASWGLGAAPGVSPGGWDDNRVYRHTPGQGAGGAASPQRKDGKLTSSTSSSSSSSSPASPSRPGLGEVVGPTVAVAYDAFYSPLLQKMDDVFVQLGFNEEACRERLVCSMYKSPARFAPHSNLISAELSKDPSELQKPSSLNSAVVRFYRYVQAARDGQTSKDCLQLYPACTVNTEL